MAEQKYLYHYTSRYHLKKIMESGYLKLTPSDLIKPVDLKIIRYEDGHCSAVSEISDHVKPVVWMWFCGRFCNWIRRPAHLPERLAP